ncbi:MAG: hypothetical protein ACE5KV_06255, partial [Thermoplasmata archaeon]
MLEALWEFLVDLATKIAEAVGRAVSFIVNLILKIIEEAFQAILSTLESATRSLLQPFVQAIGLNLERHSPVEFIGDVKDMMSYMWSPILLISGIFYGLMVVEATVNGMSAGLGALFGQAASRLVRALIISVVGVFVGSVLTIVLTNSVDTVVKLMGDAASACEYAVSAMNFVSLAIINAATRAVYLPALAFALMGIFLSMGSVLIVRSLGLPAFVAHFIDQLAIALAVVSVTDIVKNPDEKVAEFMAPVCKAFGDAISWLSVVLTPVSMLDHWLSGDYEDG